MRLLARLLDAVRVAFIEDSTKPGVVISDLGCSSWYVSVCRYPNGPTSKTVVVSAKGSSLVKALHACTVAWLVHRRRLDALKIRKSTNEIDRALFNAL